MTVKTDRPQIPWLRYSEDVARQIEQHVTPAQIEAAKRAMLNGGPAYRDAGSRDSYTVGYGGERTYERPASKPAVNGLSEKQIKFVNDLLAERVHEYTETEVAEAKADWRKGRAMIDALKAAPRKPYQDPAPARERLDFASIPDGNYAIRVDGVVKFYRVSTRNGYKNVQVRASDDLHPVFGKGGIAVLHRIVEFGLEKSQMLFATELVRCWRCGKSLTDETSRAVGMGPDCAAK